MNRGFVMELFSEIKGNQIVINKRLYLEVINDPENKFSLDIWLADNDTGQKLYLSSIAKKSLSKEMIRMLTADALKVWHRYDNKQMTA